MGKQFVEGWSVVQVLGEGAYGEVQLVINNSTNEAVAVKHLDTRKEAAAASNIQKEVFIHRRLNHENIIKYFGHREEGPIHYIFLEYAAGGELFDRIEPDVGMPHPIAQKYFLQIIKGVEYLHSVGVTHRDLKPENILLDEHDNVKISDFGLATIFRHKGTERILQNRCGTLPYVAPEVFFRKYKAEPADVWSCGILLVVMLAGDNVKISDFGLATIFRHKGTERILQNRCGTLPYVAPEVFFRKYKAEPADVWSCGILLVVMLAGELPWNEATSDCKEFILWKESSYSITPWTKIDNLALALLTKILCYSPSKRYTLKEIENHLWCKKVLIYEETTRIGVDTPAYKRLCSDVEQPCVLREDSVSKMSYSQPAPILRENSIDSLPKDISGITIGYSFSQPVDPENMILTSQFSSSQMVSKTTLPIGTRLTRFCIGMDIETVYEEIIRAFEKLNYNWKHSGKQQMTITTQDRRKMHLIFKANLIPMKEKILVDFRRSRGDGLEFKRHFLKIKDSLIKIIDKETFVGSLPTK
ncbi:Serine/threonine-protein kinase Chk1 [Araneus ventricosus]|uniref:non-specific serine/threonine protein kinase n=1 Tax=Araneus ventricosus TaxID=182803 RepID=A0A4Y2AQL6_ARAVE|nr:Serine/threonine-protein kinase Chk1 [Araneus ventricosus]